MKYFKILLLVILTVFFTACGGGGGSSSSRETPSTIATDKIMAYADDQTQPVPAVEDYADVGVIGVTAENITEINDIVASLTEEDVNTKEKIQSIAEEASITLPDNIPPVITLNGTSTITVMQGDIYTDAGATATDDRDGSVTVATTGNIDTSLVGTYTLTYTATDSTGNSATETRTVDVNAQEICIQVITHAYHPTTGEERDFATPCDVPEGWIVGNAPDTTPPIITLDGTNPTTVTQGNTYTDAGATATDNIDGTVAVITTGTVNTSMVGTYTVTYTATDSAGNTATVTRTVSVEPIPNTAPTANAGSDKTTEVNKAVTITGTGSDSDGTVVQFEWKKDSTVIGTTATITYTPTAAGTDTLTLIVTDDDGAKDSDSMIVTVTEAVVPNQAPTANAGADKTTEVDEVVIITGTGSDSDGTVVQFEWKKDSTVIGTTATITYTPTAAGTDTLTLIVTDDDGAKASDSMIVTVTAEYIPYEVPEIDETTKQAYLDAVNAARAEEQDCGVYGMMGPADPLVWNDALYKASYEHSDDMMRSDTFSHDGSNTEYDWTAVILELGRGSNLKERVENNGYSNWTTISENIAAYSGYTGDGLALVIDLWIDSDGHCHNLMNGDYKEIGMAHVDGGSGKYTDYWTQDFGTRR